MDVIPDQRARGGVAVFVRNDISIESVPLTTRLQAVAVKIYHPMTATFCNVYLPDFSWEKEDLIDLVSQLPQPFILLGDFNSHNPLWGSVRLDPRGRLVESFLNDSETVLLNDGSPTYLNTGTGNFSSIDLSISSPALAVQFRLPRPWMTSTVAIIFRLFSVLVFHCSSFPSPQMAPQRCQLGIVSF